MTFEKLNLISAREVIQETRIPTIPVARWSRGLGILLCIMSITIFLLLIIGKALNEYIEI